MKRALALLAAVPFAVALAGCGSSSDTSTAAASTTGTASPTAASTAQPVVQPCDAIDTAKLKSVLGYAISKNTGTKADPSCVLTPSVRGGAVFQLNYQWWFKGGLDASWKTMSKSISGKASTVAVPGADAARLVINPTKKAAYITGFVENDALVQVVDAEALPKDASRLKRAVLAMLAELSAGAPQS